MLSLRLLCWKPLPRCLEAAGPRSESPLPPCVWCLEAAGSRSKSPLPPCVLTAGFGTFYLLPCFLVLVPQASQSCWFCPQEGMQPASPAAVTQRCESQITTSCLWGKNLALAVRLQGNLMGGTLCRLP